jgi:arginyl-tRNA synthetase
MKKFIKRIFGIDKIEERADRMEEAAQKMASYVDEANQKVAQAEEKLAEKFKTPKEIATEKKEAWVAVLDTHVNKDNIRNGFFELDWNEYFVLQLRTAGYTGESDEAIVDQWFSELCRGVGGEEGVDMSRRGSGFINVNNLGNGKTEVF